MPIELDGAALEVEVDIEVEVEVEAEAAAKDERERKWFSWWRVVFSVYELSL